MTKHFQQGTAISILERARKAHNGGRTIIFETTYGSRLYGCETSESDNDIRGVFLPGLADFLTEDRLSVQNSMIPDGDLGESDDIQYLPTGLFIGQIMGMKVNSVEIFFAALAAQRRGETLHPAMAYLLENRDRLLRADPNGFVGHARQRASAYMDGDDRSDPTAQANRHVLACLEEFAARGSFDMELRIQDVDGLPERLEEHELVKRTVNKGGEDVFMVHTRQLPLNHRIGEGILRTRDRLERFNKKADRSNTRKMFKDLYTSLRMMETAALLMETGEITFPCARAPFYARVRAGEVPCEEVLALIDAAQMRALDVVKKGLSPLPPGPGDAEIAARLQEMNAHMRWMALKSLAL